MKTINMTRIFLAFSVVFAFFVLWSSGGTVAICLAPGLPFAQNLPSVGGVEIFYPGEERLVFVGMQCGYS